MSLNWGGGQRGGGVCENLKFREMTTKILVEVFLEVVNDACIRISLYMHTHRSIKISDVEVECTRTILLLLTSSENLLFCTILRKIFNGQPDQDNL